jgi:hypothetical protein
MNKISYSIIIVFMFCFQVLASEDRLKIHINNYYTKEFERILKIYSVSFKKENSVYVFNKLNNERVLLKLYELSVINYLISSENYFASLYKSQNYQSKYTDITNSGEILIKRDQSPLDLIFDPKHPDSIKKGQHKGYYKTTNVDSNEAWKLNYNSYNLSILLNEILANEYGIYTEKVLPIDELHYFHREKSKELFREYFDIVIRNILFNLNEDSQKTNRKQ